MTLGQMESVNSDHAIPVAKKYQALSGIWQSTVSARVERLQSMSTTELQEAFTATHRVLFYALAAGEPEATMWGGRLGEIYGELRRRGSGDTGQAEILFDQLVTLRQFDEAASLKASAPELSLRVVPVVRFAQGFDERLPAAMTLRHDGEWDVANVALTDVSVVALVGCPMSAKAVAEINEAPNLARMLDNASAVWLTDSSAVSMEGLVSWWMQEFPRQQLRVAWRNHSWPRIEFDSMPKFHFLRDGRVVGTYVGWGNDSPSELRSSLDSLMANPRGDSSG